MASCAILLGVEAMTVELKVVIDPEMDCEKALRMMHRAIITIGQTIRAQATIMGYTDSTALIEIVLLGRC